MGLTARDEQILQLTAEGMTGKEVGVSLDISEQTVKNHLTHVREVLNAKTTTHAVYIKFCTGQVTTA